MSNLLKLSLALESDTLKKRVQAAVIQTAQQQKNADGGMGNFAQLVLSDMQRHWPDFILEVAASPEVQTQLAVSDNNQTVVATNVPDDDILFIVNSTFSVAARKYVPQPNEADGESS